MLGSQRPGRSRYSRGRVARRVWQPTPAFLPGQSPGQRSRAGLSPQGHRVDTTKLACMQRREPLSRLRQLCPSEDWAWRWGRGVGGIRGHRCAGRGLLSPIRACVRPLAAGDQEVSPVALLCCSACPATPRLPCLGPCSPHVGRVKRQPLCSPAGVGCGQRQAAARAPLPTPDSEHRLAPTAA